MKGLTLLFELATAGIAVGSAIVRRQGDIEACPGYTASNVVQSATGLTADLSLAGTACNIYGTDLTDLKLEVTAETSSRLHVKIYDVNEQVYQIPESVLPRPNGTSAYDGSDLEFVLEESPFAFAVTRRSSGEVLFNTSGSAIIFETQYVRLRTQLPENPHLYGLGESTDPFELVTSNYSRTLWSRDAGGTPEWTNLYGNHPVYFDHRGASGTHGVFLASSNGMDVKINKTETSGQYLEYNLLGGVLDFYFMSGSSPTQVSQQYAEIVGLPAMIPYWGFGFHQCKYGYRDVYEVAEVVANYSLADIPLETMWTDIDYMDMRRVFSVDPERYPLDKMRELVSYLHEHQQHYVVMVDPAVYHGDYPPYNRGAEEGIFLKNSNGSVYTGVVWPGAASFPDWLSPAVQQYWDNEFAQFFSADTGVDIDALWIDMNEASNFCVWPCENPFAFAEENGDPPTPPPVRANAGRAIPGFPSDFQPSGASRMSRRSLSSRQESGKMLGLPGRDLLDPLYTINNTAGSLSNLTIRTDLQHATGQYLYDTHNMYGSMMSAVSRGAMLSRRPERRPMVITRSTFAGAGKSVGHWLGDNLATWFEYRISISQIMEFAALYQVPVNGADVCGFTGYNTTVKLCQRWATLGAFYPFFRNHADLVFNGVPIMRHEFYAMGPEVANTARDAINRRYQLLDYIYTAFHQQTVDGTPHLKPLYFLYPEDEQTFSIGFQFFYGDALLVSPVTDDNSTSVTYYLPNDVYYDYFTWEKVADSQTGQWNTLHDVPFSDITVHIKGGSIIPRRIESANTTTELRKRDFELIIAPDATGCAHGVLYLDEGDKLDQPETSNIEFSFERGHISMTGSFGYPVGDVGIVKVSVLGGSGGHGWHGPGWPRDAKHGGWGEHGGHGHGPQHGTCNSTAGYCSYNVTVPLTGAWNSFLWA